MSKKILTNPFVIAGIILFLILLFVGVYGIGFTWGESLLGSAAIAVVGVGIVWFKDFLPW